MTARSGSSQTVNVAVTAGSGTKTAWTISISGSRGGNNAEATWLGEEPDRTNLTAGAPTIISAFYAPNGTLYAAEVSQ